MDLQELDLRQRFIRPKGDLADEILRKHGFKQIGEDSSYARAYMHPKFDYIMKIYRNDPCYSRYVALAMTLKNPHYPRFRGRLMKIIDEVYAIRMERLTKFTNHDFLLQYIEDKVKGYTSYQIPYNADALKRRYPLLEAACVAIGDIVFNGPTQCMADFHSGNIMLRGDIPVIIDPAASI